jgi:PAS domain S-box-containing protein
VFGLHPGHAPVSPAHLAAIIESSRDAILSQDRHGIITSWNPGAQGMYGYTADEAVGQPISILIPPHRAGEERRILDRVLAGKPIEHYESDRVDRSGRILTVSLSVSPLVDDSGTINGAAVIARDVTALHRSRDFAERLHELTAALSGEITREGAIDRLLEQSVAGLGADAGAVGLVDRSGSEVELVGSAGYSETGIGGWKRFALDAEVPMSASIRSGEAIWTESGDELIRRFPALGEASIRFQSLAVIPLAIEGRPFGALALSFATRHRFDTEARTFLITAVRQAAQTLDRARLYEGERRARERVSFLAAASNLLAGSLDPETTLQNLADLAVRQMADWCGIELVDDEGGLRNVATAHVDPARVRLAHELRERYPADPKAPIGVPNVIRTGRPEIYPEIADEILVESAVDDEHLRLMRELGLVSAMIVPLEARGRVLGALTLIASESGRHYDDSDLELAGDLAQRAALAIDNSMLFHREHEAAVTLQRSLLPHSLPRARGVELAARYEPAAAGTEVGGDWYDAVALDEDTLVLTIGDIAGRGIRAASVMGRIAVALRAYSLDRKPPDEAVQLLNRLMRELEGQHMATLLHLRIDLASGGAEYVRAGHPPGLLRHPDGEVERLEGAGTPPIGVFDEIECPIHRTTVARGSLLLLYTDGLIERRDGDFELELERLSAELAKAPGDPDACLRRLADRFGAEAIPDDAAMLALSRR